MKRGKSKLFVSDHKGDGAGGREGRRGLTCVEVVAPAREDLLRRVETTFSLRATLWADPEADVRVIWVVEERRVGIDEVFRDEEAGEGRWGWRGWRVDDGADDEEGVLERERASGREERGWGAAAR